MADENQGITYGEPHPEPEKEEPQSCVVVLAYTSSDGNVEDDFGKYVQDIKALYSFKENVRAYLLVEDAAQNVLAKVEKPTGEPSGRAVMVISYDQADDTDEAFARLSRTADTVRDLFKDEADVQVDIAVREAADEVLSAFPRGEG